MIRAYTKRGNEPAREIPLAEPNNAVKSEYYSFIELQQIIPPLPDGLLYEATAKIFQVGVGELEHGLPASHGVTEEEAKAKMQQDIDGWIAGRKNEA